MMKILKRVQPTMMKIILASVAVFLAILNLTSAGLASEEHAPLTAPRSTTTVSYQIGALSDDANQDGATIYPFNLSLTLGDNGTLDHHNGVRYTGVNIPQGAVITEAHLVFTAWTDTSGPASMLIRGHDIGDSPTFSLSNGPMDRLAQANTPIVTWSPVDWTWESSYTTPDLSPILQQIIDRPDWSPGNALTLLISDSGGITGGERIAYSYDRDAIKAPRLYVTYEGANTVNMINPGIFGGAGEVNALPRPDLAVTSVTTNQFGYRAESNYEITVTVTNVGLEPANGVQVEATIERVLQGTTWLAIGPVQGAIVTPIVLSSPINLSPGETVELQSGMRPLDPDVVVEPAIPGSWVPGVPNHSTIYVRSSVLPASTETNLANNESLSTFIFPTGPADSEYDINNDNDLDGWEDEDEPSYCRETPLAYPGGIDFPGDGINGDCDGGDNPDGWALTGNPEEGIANNPSPDADTDGDGFSANQGDCWEGPNPPGSIAYPGAIDIPDGYDNDCDGQVDEDFSMDLFEGDVDGDGVSVAAGDCDDLNGSIRPGASELPDGVDNDCDGFIDEGHLTPDWAITNFQVTPQDTECQRFTHPELWVEDMQCGLNFELEIDNIGEDLGMLALEVVRNSAYVTDLVRDYGIPPSGSILYPYTTWQPWPMVELMACGPIGFIAVIPATSGQGQLGESNLLNNQAIAYPQTFEQDIDIQFNTDILTRIRYPHTSLVDDGIYDRILIEPSVFLEGSCPPPALLDYWTQVKVYKNSELLFDHTALSVDSSSTPIVNDPQENPYRIRLDPRPANGDTIRIEILLNSDGMVSEVDTTNNLCVLEFEYDRAGLGSSRSNDRMVSIGADGCSASLRSGGETSSVGSSLVGGSPGTNILLGGLLVGAIGGLLGWRFTAGAGRSLAGILAGAGTGVVAGGAVGAVGTILITRMMTAGTGSLEEFRPLDIVAADIPARQAVESISNRWSGETPTVCSAMFEPMTEVVLDQDGQLSDVVLSWNLDAGDLSDADRIRLTVWDASASPHELIPSTTPVSLAKEGLLDLVDDTVLWQLEVEEYVGGDLYLARCTPSLQQLSLVEHRIAQRVREQLGQAPLFGGCDPDDPDCHVWARLEFINGVPTLALDVSLNKTVADQAQELDLAFLTELSYGQGGETVAGPINQVDLVAQLTPGEVINVDGVEYVPFTIHSKVPAQLQGIVSLDGSLDLALGSGGLSLGSLPVMAEALDLTPPPTPTPIPTPTPTPTPLPDTSGPKVGGVNDNPDPILTNGNKPDKSTVSATVSDPSGVASVTLYYRSGGGGAFQVWGGMSGSGGSYSAVFGPFGSLGNYEYRIYAVDGLGNANCSKGSVGSCPGGTLTVNIP